MQVFIHKGSAPPAQTVIDTSARLGRGATATIYRVSYGGESWAAKVYHKDRGLNSEKVLAMLANVPANTQIEVGGRSYPQFAWPCALLKDRRGADVGYLMPLVDIDDSYTLDHYYDQGLFKKLNRPDEAALSYKLEIAKNLSTLIAELHRHQHYFIDCKPQNIRVFRRTHVVTLLDCDGFSIFGNGRRYPAELLSTDYIAPEAQRRNSSPADLAEPQDRYALAVILFQLLNGGTHPFQGIVAAPNIMVNTNDEKAAAGLYPHGVISDARIKPRPQSTHHLWEDDTRALFDRAFTSSPPTERPSAQEWADHFKSLLDNKVLVRCDRMPDNLEHIRFRGKGCPACYLSALPTFRPQTRPETPRVQPAPTPSAPVPAQGSNKGWWIAGGLAAIFLIAVFNSNDEQNRTTTASTTPAVTFPVNLYVADAFEKQNIWDVAYQSLNSFGTYQTRMENILSIPTETTGRHASGHQSRRKARELIGIAWEIMISEKRENAPLAYWANYQALKLGHPEAASNLGYMHELGIGIPVDYKKAGYWYQKTIDMGEPHSAQAEIQLARLYQLGKMGKVDLNRAKELYESALQLANGPNWPGSRSQYVKEIQAGLTELSVTNAANTRNRVAVQKADSRPTNPVETIGFVSVFVSDGRAAGWVVGHPTQRDADNAARASCRSFANADDRESCKKLVGSQGRCVGVARSPDGGFGAAWGNTEAQVSTGAIRGCESKGAIGCAVPPKGARCQ